MSKYPTRDQIELPPPDEVSPDQEYYFGWFVQHNRLWVAFAGICVALFLALSWGITQAKRFKPSVVYVTLEGGYPVIWNEAGNVEIDGVEYFPVRLRSVVRTFVENRYAWDYQNLQKVNTALRLMSAEAAQEERRKIMELNPEQLVGATRTRVRLNMDYSNWKVVAQGQGRFNVSIQGQVLINDAVRHTDPLNPFVRNVTIELVVQSAPATDVNPLGYFVVGTGRDVL